MKAALLSFLLVISPAAVLAAPSAPAQAPKAVPAQQTVLALKLVQHCALCGDCDVFMTKSDLLLKTEKSHLHFVCAAPFKEVTVYSTLTGKIVRVPVNFKNPFASARAFLAGVDLSVIPMDEGGVTTVCQKTCQVFKSKPAWTEEQKARRLKKECGGGEPVEARTEYLKSTYNPVMMNLVAHIHGVPELDLLPISLCYREAGGPTIDIKHLQTYKIETVPVKESIFKVPGGLKTVKSMNEVIQDASADSAMELMLGH